MLLSFVIPTFDEARSIEQLVTEIGATVRALNHPYEIVLVDDGSRDLSWAKIQELAASNPCIQGIRLRRNFGKSEALHAGFQTVRGDVIFTMDADLQDDPREIPKFLDRLQQGYDVVSGWKRVRQDAWHKRIASQVFNALVNSFTPVKLHDHNCGFKCYRREVLQEIHLYGDMHRFVPVLAGAKGFRVGEVEVQHRQRPYGRSKYGWRRIPKGLLDVITVGLLVNYRGRPQHFLGLSGLCIFAGALAVTVWLATKWFLSRYLPGQEPIHLHDRALFYFALAGLLLGAQLLSLGFLAELFAFTFRREQTHYSVAERVGGEASHPDSTGKQDPFRAP